MFYIIIYLVTSVKLHESGWAWLVAGSKMLLWRFSTNQLTVCTYVDPGVLTVGRSSSWAM